MNVELVGHIEEQGAAMPDLVAVRLMGSPVTYRQLADEVAARLDPVDQTEHSASVALFSALMSKLPYRLRTVGLGEDVRVVGTAMGWLSEYTHIGRSDRHLSAVG